MVQMCLQMNAGAKAHLSACVGIIRDLIPPASKALAAVGLLPQGLDLHQGQLLAARQQVLPCSACLTLAPSAVGPTYATGTQPVTLHDCNCEQMMQAADHSHQPSIEHSTPCDKIAHKWS